MHCVRKRTSAPENGRAYRFRFSSFQGAEAEGKDAHGARLRLPLVAQARRVERRTSGSNFHSRASFSAIRRSIAGVATAPQGESRSILCRRVVLHCHATLWA